MSVIACPLSVSPQTLHRAALIDPLPPVLGLILQVYLQVYDAGEFSLLCNEPSGKGNQWCGGEFISIDKVIVWSDTGQAFLYKLPSK